MKYELGTWVETKTGYVKVKVSKNKWEGVGPHLLKKAGFKLEDGERVFFKDGDRENREISNLVPIKFNARPVILESSRPIYLPGVSKYDFTNEILARARRRGLLKRPLAVA